jgi:hypothetical protein
MFQTPAYDYGAVVEVEAEVKVEVAPAASPRTCGAAVPDDPQPAMTTPTNAMRRRRRTAATSLR